VRRARKTAGQRSRPLSAEELYQGRVAYSKNRILRVLRGRIAVYRRELERQVCEVGFSFKDAPPEHRPEPHHMTAAIAALKAEEAIKERTLRFKGTPYVFWSLASVGTPTVEAVMERKTRAHAVFQTIEHNPALSGYHAESIHHKALTSAGQWRAVHWQGGAKIGGLGAYALTEEGDVDLAGFHIPSGGIPFVAQVKNGREWVYPPNDVMWDLLGAAAQLQAVPILIARRLPEATFAFMKTVGGFAFRSIHMILHPDLATAVPLPDLPTLAEALREFGFHTDIDFITEPLPRHSELWTGALNSEIAEMHPRFTDLTDEIMYIAYEEGLSSHRHRSGVISGAAGSEITYAFAKRVRERHREEGLARHRAQHPPDEPEPEPEPEPDYDGE